MEKLPLKELKVANKGFGKLVLVVKENKIEITVYKKD